jgi:DNA transformation protein
MKASPEYLNFISDKLAPIGNIKSRAMFGGYGIFHEGLMFALISEDLLYFKVDDTNRDMYKKAQSQPFPHGISYWEVPSDVLEENTELQKWANVSIKIAHEAAKKKRK